MNSKLLLPMVAYFVGLIMGMLSESYDKAYGCIFWKFIITQTYALSLFSFVYIIVVLISKLKKKKIHNTTP